jgi:peroxiredoxin
MKKSVIGILAVIGLIVIVVGIGGGKKSETGVSQSEQQLTANASASVALQLAPDFTATKLGGGTISLSDYRGKKPVVLDFWASWCPNCKRDMPRVSALYPKYKEQVEIIGVNIQEKESVVAGFIASKGIVFPIALDPTGSISAKYGVNYTNFHVLINTDGTIAGSIPGDLSEEALVALISAQPKIENIINE